jgi:hypothetical protein
VLFHVHGGVFGSTAYIHEVKLVLMLLENVS